MVRPESSVVLRRVLVVVVWLLAAVVAGSTGGAAANISPSETPHVDRGAIPAATPLPQTSALARNNSTTRHIHPDNVSIAGDPAVIRQRVTTEIEYLITSCTQNLSVGQFQACRQLANDYPGWVRKYSAVAAETATERDDRALEAFRALNQTQLEYSAEVRQALQLYQAYQEAKANGNQTRMRVTARKLAGLTQETNASAQELIAIYRAITNRSKANLEPAIDDVRLAQRRVKAITNQVTENLFVEPHFVITNYTRRVSFRDPLVVSGYVATPNGSIVSVGRVQLRVGNQTIGGSLRAPGRFRFRYRPQLLSLSIDRLRLYYQPLNSSRYLATNTSKPLTVTQMPSSLSIRVSKRIGQYGEQLRISGRFTAGGQETANIPLRIAIGDRTVRTVRTNANGSYEIPVRIPASYPIGIINVTARTPFSNQSVESQATTTQFRVTQTQTKLALTVTHRENRSIRIAGSLRTNAGQAVANQPIQLRVGEKITRIQTNASGGYTTTLTVPVSALSQSGNSTVTVNAVFNGSGTNLASAQAQNTVRLPVSLANFSSDGEDGLLSDGEDGLLSDGEDGLLSDGRLSQILIGLIIIGGIAIVVYRDQFQEFIKRIDVNHLRRAIESSGRSENQIRSDDNDQHSNTSAEERSQSLTQLLSDTGTETTQPLDQLVVSNPDRAVIVTYEGLRSYLNQQSTTNGHAYTHWEFYNTHRENGWTDDQVMALQQLTEAYEIAAFTDHSVSIEEAEAAIEHADRFLS